MTIGIITGFSKKHSAGLEEFLLGLLAGLATLPSNGIRYRIYTSAGSDLPEALAERSITGFEIITVGWGSWWKHIGLFAPRSDIYIWNGPVVSPFFFPRHSFVLVYDFAYRHYSKVSLHTRMIDWLSSFAFRHAEGVIAISQATADDVNRFFDVPTTRLAVMYPGTKDFLGVTEESRETPSRGFFLFVGTTKERKNVLNLVRAYALVARDVPEDLLIAGRCDLTSLYGKNIVAVIAEASISSRVHFLGPISEGTLKYLYRHTTAFVFPSAFEGFGMPVVEAMGQGAPVLTSNASSLPEAAGGAALLVDPTDPTAIAGGLLQLSREPALRTDLIEKGKSNSVKFSWEASAKILLEVVSRA